jgi:hypothetical protein
MTIYTKTCVLFIILICISLTSVQAFDTSPREKIIWETNDDNPYPASDHTRCEVLFAEGTYWLFYDWVSGISDSSDIYMRKSSDAVMWSELTPVADNPGINETRPRAFFYDNLIYLTYSVGGSLMVRTSSNGMDFSDEQPLYSSPVGNYDIEYANDWFYLAYESGGDIWFSKSLDLSVWEAPEVAVRTSDPDFTPDLCVAMGRIWLAWNHRQPAHPFLTSSIDGIEWTSHVEIPINDPDNTFGPFCLTWYKGQFIFVTRVAVDPPLGLPYWHWPWRMMMTTSQDGITWTPFVQVSELFPSDERYQEKGGVIFQVHGGYKENKIKYKFAVIFKRMEITWWNSDPYPKPPEFIYGQLCQAFLNP